MTSSNDKSMTLGDFERLLDVYGGDRSRWPLPARTLAGALVARDRAAQRLLAQSEALDRVLERAPMPSLAREAALTERILSSARRSPRMVPTSTAASPGPARAAGNVIAFSPAPARPSWLTPRTAFGGAAGGLAASLIIGVFIGLSSLAQSVLPALEQLTGIALSPTTSLSAQFDLEEDLL
jgi:hypothetical protein